MTAKDKLEKWIDLQIQIAKKEKEEFWFDVPDKGYDNMTLACENGHISHRWLKSEEEGSLCLACWKPVYLVPNETTEEDLAKILNS